MPLRPRGADVASHDRGSTKFCWVRRSKLAGKKVVLTREAGKNAQLEQRLSELGIQARQAVG